MRFIQLYHRDWDHHGGIKDGIKLKAEEVDQPLAALINDLKQLGMLDDTLIVLRRRVRPHADVPGRQRPRPPHEGLPHAGWPAAASRAASPTARPTSSATTRSRTSSTVHDLHATMLHLLGIDHERLTYKFQGRDFRLTDVHGNVVKDILA